jgi:hypothetical protein
MCVCVYRGVTGYLKKLKEFLNSPAGKKAEEEDVKIKQIALRSTENLQVGNPPTSFLDLGLEF